MTHALHNFHFHEQNVPGFCDNRCLPSTGTVKRCPRAWPLSSPQSSSLGEICRKSYWSLNLVQFKPIQANSSFLALLFIKQDPAPRMRRKSRVGIRLIHDASVPLCLDNRNPTGCISSLTDGRQNFSVLGMCLVAWYLITQPPPITLSSLIR